MTDIPLYAGAGFLVGTLVCLTGVGGGSMMTPILMLLFGQSPSVAVGTDLLFSATTKLVATASFGFSRRVDWPIVVMLVALYPLRLTADRLVATDIAHALPVTLIACFGHALLGHVNFNVLAALLLGSIPGVLIASRISIRLPARITRVLIAVMLGTVSERLLFA